MTGCLNESILQAWLDGELSPEASAAARLHVAGCAVCAAQARAAQTTFALVDDAWQVELPGPVPAGRLRARLEERLAARPARIDRFWWWQIAAARWRTGAAIAVLALIVAGALAIRGRTKVPPQPQTLQTAVRVTLPAAPALPAKDDSVTKSAARSVSKPSTVVGDHRPPLEPRRTWLESETNRHLGQMQLLLRSIRNAEAETDADVSYERELSRELLTRNRLLRRSAEQKDATRAEALLIQVEPLLLDIANLPEQPAPEDMRTLRELISGQQIIAELQLYAAGNHLF